MKAIVQENEGKFLQNLRNLFGKLHKLFCEPLCESTRENYSQAYKLTLQAITQLSVRISQCSSPLREILGEFLSRLNQIAVLLESTITFKEWQELKELSDPRQLPSIEVIPKIETLEEAERIIQNEYKEALRERRSLARLIIIALIHCDKDSRVFTGTIEEIKQISPLIANAIQKVCQLAHSSTLLNQLLSQEDEGRL